MDLMAYINNLIAGSSDSPRPTYKAGLDRPLYSQQSRAKTLARAGITTDPLTQTYFDNVNEAYRAVPSEYADPRANLLGILEAEKLQVDPNASPSTEAELSNLLHAYLKRQRFPGKEPTLKKMWSETEAGTYTPSKNEIALKIEGQTNADLLAALAHESEHAKDTQSNPFHYSKSINMDLVNRNKFKKGHHQRFNDFEVDAALVDMAQSALAAGEWINPDLLVKFPWLQKFARKNSEGF